MPNMIATGAQLETLGHEVKMPPLHVLNENGEQLPVLEYYAKRKSAQDDDLWVWERKAEAIKLHFSKIEWADAVLVINPEKNGIRGYVGSNTLIEKSGLFLGAYPPATVSRRIVGNQANSN